MRWKRRKVVFGTGDYLNVCIMVAGTHSEACDESRGTKKFTGGNKICSRSAFDRENLSFFFFFLSFFFLRVAERSRFLPLRPLLLLRSPRGRDEI